MKKQKAKQSKTRHLKHPLIRASLLLTALTLATLILFCAHKAVSRENPEQIRELILLSVRTVKKDAPVDPKTGDIYFPESRLYLPNPKQVKSITYLQDDHDIAGTNGGLSVSTYPLHGTTPLYTARTHEQLFDAVPKLQACSRGIKLVYDKMAENEDGNILRQTVQLGNGRTLYVYVEEGCPELNETADLFANVRAY